MEELPTSLGGHLMTDGRGIRQGMLGADFEQIALGEDGFEAEG